MGLPPTKPLMLPQKLRHGRVIGYDPSMHLSRHLAEPASALSLAVLRVIYARRGAGCAEEPKGKDLGFRHQTYQYRRIAGPMWVAYRHQVVLMSGRGLR